jgi:DeoR family glycerol-3-phosphate regulon repressor
MAQTFRQAEILELARRSGKVTVDGLSDYFGVAVQTIRRDLADLADTGHLQRVHGGAILGSSTQNIDYAQRQGLNRTAKAAIAKACAEILPDDASVFLNIGTTTEATAVELSRHQNLMVVTNNINVATTLSPTTSKVILTGGTLRPKDGGLVGPMAIETIRNFKFDHAVIGCSALDVDGDILDFDIQEVGVTHAIINQSRHVTLVADHTKFDRNAPVRIGSIQQVDCFVTDRPLPPELQAKCDDWNTKVIVAGA